MADRDSFSTDGRRRTLASDVCEHCVAESVERWETKTSVGAAQEGDEEI
jgi:hypothetical protein